MSKSELITTLITSAGIFISLVALWISNWQNRRNKKIKKTIFFLNNFLCVYKYLFKNNNKNVYEIGGWIDKYDMYIKLNNNKILENSISFLYPDIFMESIYFYDILKKETNDFSKALQIQLEKKFLIIKSKAIDDLETQLEKSTNKQIKKSLKFWKSMYKKINNIQKILFKEKIVMLKQNKLVINSDKFKNVNSFWIEVSPETSDDIFKKNDKLFLFKLMIYFKNKLKKKETNYIKIIFLKNLIEPFLYRKSKLFIIKIINKQNKETQLKYWNKKLLDFQETHYE